MSNDQVLSFSVVSVVEDVIIQQQQQQQQQQGARSSDYKFVSRKTEEACIYPFPLFCVYFIIIINIFAFTSMMIFILQYVISSSFCEN
jgi:hypothetical protein